LVPLELPTDAQGGQKRVIRPPRAQFLAATHAHRSNTLLRAEPVLIT